MNHASFPMLLGEKTKRVCPWLFPVLAALLASGCTSSDDAAGAGMAVIQITDAEFDALTRLELTITRVDLFTDGGSTVQVFPPDSVPGGQISVDLVRLGSGRRVIAVGEAPENSYVAARITFQDVEASAGSTAQTVSGNSGSIRIEFAEERDIGDGEVKSFLLDFDGRASVTSTGATSIDFDPTVFEITGDAATFIEELEGEVEDVDDDRFVLAVDDAERGEGEAVVELGRLQVLVDPDTFYLIDGSLFAGEDGLDRLAEDTVVEVSGRILDGALVADLVKVDKEDATNPIRARGHITKTSPLTFRLGTVERDEDGQLASADPGDLFTLTTGAGTLFTRQVGSGPLDVDDLFSGQAVEVVGDLTAASAITAAAIELRETALTGTVGSVDLLAGTAVLDIAEVDGVPVAQFTAIGNTAQETLLLLNTVRVDVERAIEVARDDLTNGQEIEARGFFSKAGDGVTVRSEFTAGGISLEAQDHEGDLLSVNFPAGTFTVDIAGTPVTVLLLNGTRLGQRRASSADRIFNLTRDDFLSELDDASDPIEIRGRREANEIQATRTVIRTP